MARRPSVVIILEPAQFEALTRQVSDNIRFYTKSSDIDQVVKWVRVLARFQTVWKAYHEVQQQ